MTSEEKIIDLSRILGSCEARVEAVEAMMQDARRELSQVREALERDERATQRNAEDIRQINADRSAVKPVIERMREIMRLFALLSVVLGAVAVAFIEDARLALREAIIAGLSSIRGDDK